MKSWLSGLREEWNAAGDTRWWLAILATFLIAGVAWALGFDFFLVLAAASGVTALLFAMSQGRAQQRQLDDHGAHLKYLADVARSQQSRQPEPSVELLTDNDEPSPTLDIVRPPLVKLDIDKIVADALSARPSTSAPQTAGDKPPLMQAFATMMLDESAQYARAFPKYEADLRAWLEDFAAYLRAVYEITRIPLRFRNSGAATLEEAQVRLKLDPPLRAAYEPELVPPPPKPPRRMFDTSLDAILLNRPFMPSFPPVTVQSNVRGPFWEEPGTEVQYTVEQIIQGLWDDTGEGDELLVKVPEDGRFDIAWLVFAPALLEPRSEALTIAVSTSGGPVVITGLAAAVALYNKLDEAA